MQRRPRRTAPRSVPAVSKHRSGRVEVGMILNQPWAKLVVEGVFPVLVRRTSTHVRERVAVVARGVDHDALVDGKEPDSHEFPEPAFLGYVEVADCVPVRGQSVALELRRRYGKEFAEFYPKHYLPQTGRAFLWVLRSPRPFRRPRKLEVDRRRVWIRLGSGRTK